MGKEPLGDIISFYRYEVLPTWHFFPDLSLQVTSCSGFSQSVPSKYQAPPRSFLGRQKGTYPGAGTRLGPVKVPVNSCSWNVPVVETCTRGKMPQVPPVLKKTDENVSRTSGEAHDPQSWTHSTAMWHYGHMGLFTIGKSGKKLLIYGTLCHCGRWATYFIDIFPQHEAWLDATILGVNTLERALHWLIKTQHAACVFDCTLCPQ